MDSRWQPVMRNFGAWMKYRNLSTSTQRIYLNALTSLVLYLATTKDDPGPEAVTRRHIERFVTARLTKVEPATVSADFRALQQFFKWLVREEEIERKPMDGAGADRARTA